MLGQTLLALSVSELRNVINCSKTNVTNSNNSGKTTAWGRKPSFNCAIYYWQKEIKMNRIISEVSDCFCHQHPATASRKKRLRRPQGSSHCDCSAAGLASTITQNLKMQNFVKENTQRELDCKYTPQIKKLIHQIKILCLMHHLCTLKASVPKANKSPKSSAWESSITVHVKDT